MFHSARFKLTAWYLLIIVLISSLFSLVIYKGAERELERIARRQHQWSQRLPEFFRRENRPFWFEPIEVEEIRKRIILMLGLVNLGILVISGVAGYFLAGRTLKPIKEMLEEQNRFIADASHELRTPLTVLKTATEVGLRDKKITRSQLKKLLQENLESINGLQNLSNNLLKLAQFEQPNSNFSLLPVSLLAILTEATKKIKPLAQAKNIEVQLSVLEDYSFLGDKESLVELLTIILDNAIKYSLPGKKVKVLAKKTARSLFLEIKDQGKGIEKEDLPYVFDRFYRGDKSRSEVAGYGLGLSIAKKIAERHRGTIKINSIPSQGTTVIVEFPLA